MLRRMLVALCAVLSTLVGFVAGAGAGVSVTSPTSLPLPHPLCPNTANAVPNDNDSDQNAFECAVRLLAAEGGLMYVTAGTYRLTAPLLITNKHIAIRGEGQQISQIVWNHGDDGIRFVSTDPILNFTLSVRSISLLKTHSSAGPAIGGAAISGIWYPPCSHWSTGIVTTTIDDVHVGTVGWPSSSNYWNYGIRLRSSTTAKISMFNLQGQSATHGEAGIRLEADARQCGPEVKQHSLSIRIHSGSIQKYKRGIETQQTIEGVHVQDVAIHEASEGIMVNAGTGTALSNNYILARQVGIGLSGNFHISVTNNQVEQFEATNFVGIRVTGGDGTRVMGNNVYSPNAAANREGIVLQGNVSRAIVEGNNTSSMSTGISIDATAGGGHLVMANINRYAGTPCAYAGAVVTSCASGSTAGGTGTNNFVHNH